MTRNARLKGASVMEQTHAYYVRNEAGVWLVVDEYGQHWTRERTNATAFWTRELAAAHAHTFAGAEVTQ